jgi:hypothetical protein
LRVDEGRAGDGEYCRRGNHRLEHVILHRCFWYGNDEPLPRRSKLNFRQDEMISGLRLCNLRQKLEFIKYRPSIAFRRSNPPREGAYS